MVSKIITLTLLLFISLLSVAQEDNGSIFFDEYDNMKFMYVSDEDMYVNVRETADAKSRVTDTVYNLQIVQVSDKPDNGWYRSPMGYIHQSRLAALPYYMQKSLTNDFWGYNTSFELQNNYFIASKSCPQIVVICDGRSDLKIIPYVPYRPYSMIDGKERTGDEQQIIITPYEGHSIFYSDAEGQMKLIAGTTIIAPLQNIVINHNHVSRDTYPPFVDNVLCQFLLFLPFLFIMITLVVITVCAA